ncbi:MAG: glycoside hydrolase family 3 N-terminal domain-containing protein [Nannocystaceae bacterium]|nr:hypothetical protein [Myxococcales bacterium]
MARQSQGAQLGRRRALEGALCGLACAALPGCRSTGEAPAGVRVAPPQPPAEREPLVAAPTEPAEPADDAALRAMIGQLLIVGFRGRRAPGDAPIARDLAERNLGGVLLFDRDDILGDHKRNIESPTQLRALTDDLRAAATTAPIIAIDQEGGYVNRLLPRYGFRRAESAWRLGQGPTSRTRAVAGTIADALANAGITMNFAPVVDLRTNPKSPIIAKVERSFSRDPEVVTRHARAFIAAHHDRGLACAIKHFPGHGSARADSHLGFVDITETWRREELDPFRALIAAGDCDAVMTGHLFHAALDPEVPATLSKPVITDLLRGELGHAGVVISDDMHMGAIVDNYSLDDALRRALAAGVDLLILGNNARYSPDTAAQAIDVIAEHVAQGRLPRATIEAAHARVTALKERLAAPPAERSQG